MTDQTPWEGEVLGEKAETPKAKRQPKTKPAPATFRPEADPAEPKAVKTDKVEKVDKKAEKAALKEAVDAAVAATTEKLQAKFQKELEKIEAGHTKAMDKLQADHDKALDKLQADHAKALEKGQKDFDKLEAKLSKLEGKLAEANDSLSNTEALLVAKTAEVKELQKKFDNLQVAHLAVHKEKDTIQQQLDAARGVIANIRSMLPPEVAVRKPRAKKGE